MTEYQKAVVEQDPETGVIAVPDQPEGSVLIAFDLETKDALLMYRRGPVEGESLTREEALPIFVTLMGREPATEELP